MRFLFSLLRIKDLYNFRALLAHPQEALTSGTWYIMLCQLAAPGSTASRWVLLYWYPMMHGQQNVNMNNQTVH
jgi:hypothetical protein